MFELYDAFVHYVVGNLLGFSPNQRLYGVFHFLYTLKIFTLLALIIFVISFIRS